MGETREDGTLTKALGEITAAEAREIANTWIHPIHWRQRMLAFVEQAERAHARVAELEAENAAMAADRIEHGLRGYRAGVAGHAFWAGMPPSGSALPELLRASRRDGARAMRDRVDRTLDAMMDTARAYEDVTREGALSDALDAVRALPLDDDARERVNDADKLGAAREDAQGESAQRDGVALIAAERRRQIESEGWTPEHDDGHKDGELAMAAACYAAPLPVFVRVPLVDGSAYRDPWPWDRKWDKRPRDAGGRFLAPTREERRRMLAKAGALIAAELDRMAREDAQGGNA